MIRMVVAALAVMAFSGLAEARSSAVRRDYAKSHPCPYAKGNCTLDHIKPLACGGPDAPGNLQWQTKEAAKAKDKWERKGCRKR